MVRAIRYLRRRIKTSREGYLTLGFSLARFWARRHYYCISREVISIGTRAYLGCLQFSPIDFALFRTLSLYLSRAY